MDEHSHSGSHDSSSPKASSLQDSIERLAACLNVSIGNSKQEMKSIRSHHGKPACFTSTIKSLAQQSPRSSELSVGSLEEQALLRQWIELRLCTALSLQIDQALLESLNSSLRNRTFLASNHVSVADLLWFSSIASLMENAPLYTKEKWIHVSRWLSQVQAWISPSASSPFYRSRTLLYS